MFTEIGSCDRVCEFALPSKHDTIFTTRATSSSHLSRSPSPFERRAVS
jgi:hypothetical protein